MKFRALLGDRFIDIEAADPLSAQELAFAKHVRSLKPQDFVVWETNEDDVWVELTIEPDLTK